MTEQASAWTRFWNRGGLWRALLLAALYLGIYLLIGFVIGRIVPEGGDVRGAAGSAADVFFATALPIILTSVLLLAFAASVGWLRTLFARQSLAGRGWMWTALVVVLAINVSALLNIDYADAGVALVGTWMLAGLFVGLVEELVTRGFVVTMMRKAGRGEIAVALASAGIFAALHLVNVFTTSQGIAVTLLQVLYTFAFGICMYLILRVSRTLIAPILVHASTDPTLFLQGEHPVGGSIFALLPALSTYLVIVTGLVLLIVLIVSERRASRGTRVDTVLTPMAEA